LIFLALIIHSFRIENPAGFDIVVKAKAIDGDVTSQHPSPKQTSEDDVTARENMIQKV